MLSCVGVIGQQFEVFAAKIALCSICCNWAGNPIYKNEQAHCLPRGRTAQKANSPSIRLQASQNKK
jgi:hypothetical protein